MTVCIAVKCPFEELIITVSDKRLSYGDDIGAADNAATKTRDICKRWGMMWSTDDVGPVDALWREIHYRLSGRTDADRDEVERVVCTAYSEAHQKAAADRYLLRYGVPSVAEFRKTGLAEFGPEMFGQIMGEIGSFDLGIQLLVYGFSPPPFSSFQHIFEVRNPGAVFDHHLEGFGVIGSGSLLALPHLMGQRGFDYLNDAVYRALEAKFMAETASGVGKATTVLIYTQHGTTSHLPEKAVDELRAIWEANRKQDIPYEADDVLNKGLKNLKDFLENPVPKP